jgi:hypothetical protein
MNRIVRTAALLVVLGLSGCYRNIGARDGASRPPEGSSRPDSLAPGGESTLTEPSSSGPDRDR